MGASGLACGVRQVLRTMVASSAMRAEKLCTGVPSYCVWRCALASAALERVVDAMGSRMALACFSVSTSDHMTMPAHPMPTSLTRRWRPSRHVAEAPDSPIAIDDDDAVVGSSEGCGACATRVLAFDALDCWRQHNRDHDQTS